MPSILITGANRGLGFELARQMMPMAGGYSQLAATRNLPPLFKNWRRLAW